MKNSIVKDYMQKVDTPVGKRYRQISEDVLYETYHDRLPVFFVEDICKDILQKTSVTSIGELMIK